MTFGLHLVPQLRLSFFTLLRSCWTLLEGQHRPFRVLRYAVEEDTWWFSSKLTAWKSACLSEAAHVVAVQHVLSDSVPNSASHHSLWSCYIEHSMTKESGTQLGKTAERLPSKLRRALVFHHFVRPQQVTPALECGWFKLVPQVRVFTLLRSCWISEAQQTAKSVEICS